MRLPVNWTRTTLFLHTITPGLTFDIFFSAAVAVLNMKLMQATPTRDLQTIDLSFICSKITTKEIFWQAFSNVRAARFQVRAAASTST
jgi:hypothetical protein